MCFEPDSDETGRISIFTCALMITQLVDEEVDQIQKAMGSAVHVSFDCVGYNKTMTTALNATSSGGKVCLIGLALTEMTVRLTPAAAR